MDENPISWPIETNTKFRSSVNEVNIVESINAKKITDFDKRAADGEAEHASSTRRVNECNTEESTVSANENSSHDRAIESVRFEEGNRRKSEVPPLPKAVLTTFEQPRGKSTSEVERQHNSNSSNLKPTLAFYESDSDFAWRSDGNMYNETSPGVTTTKRSICDSERVQETLRFPAMSRVNGSEKVQLSVSDSTHHKESKGNRLPESQHRRLTRHAEHLLDEKRNFEKRDSTEKLHLPVPVQGESTRGRSLSDSEVLDSVQYNTMSPEQREKLNLLKREIYETNSKRKDCMKMSERKSDASYGKQSAGSAASRERVFPVLTEKSLKRHTKSHGMANCAAPELLSAITAIDEDRTTCDTNARSNASDTSSVEENRIPMANSAGHMIETNLDKRDTSLNTEQSSDLPLIASLAYSADSHEGKRESYRLHFPTPPTSQDGDSSESISMIIQRLRVRSEPGDIGTRKLSTIKQLHNRARSETDALKVKVQSFVEKPLPALPPSSLRVKKSNVELAKSDHFKAGANANISPQPRERKDGVINIHTCPNLNLFSDQSWMYQDKSQKKHRYIRGPATPVPPVDFVFRKGKPDSS